MRPVRGFEHPLLQWIFVGLSVVLMAVVVVGALALRRERGRRDAIHAAELEGRLDRQQLEMRLAREQSAREALSIEVARLRGSSSDGSQLPPPPTLTLTPISAPSATPPDPSVEQPPSEQPIALRLVLPRGADVRRKFSVSLRSWSGGAVLWMRGDVPATAVDGRPMVIALITGDVLASGAYEVTVSAEPTDSQPSTPVASYQVAVGGGLSP
jgi:hypothetical protein